MSMDMAQNILVIKTVAGMAMAACLAIDAMNWSEVGEVLPETTQLCVQSARQRIPEGDG